MVWKRQRGRADRRDVTGGPPASAESTPPTLGPERDGDSPLASAVFLDGLRPIPTGGLAGRQPWPALDIVGVAPSGARRSIWLDSFDGRLLIVFLTTNCDGCDQFWDGLRDDAPSPLPEGTDAVVVTKGELAVSRQAVAKVATGIDSVPVVMSDQAWADYHVLGYPFFVVVDAPSRSVIAETVGFGWPDVTGLLG